MTEHSPKTNRVTLRVSAADLDAMAAVAAEIRTKHRLPFATRTDALRYALHQVHASLAYRNAPTN